MSKIILEYFPVRGRAEVTKLALAAKGVDWDLVMPDRDVMKTDRDKYPFGQCPRLIDGDLSVVQSGAMLRYLARKLSLYGASEAEAITVDEVLEGVESLRVKYLALIYQDQLAEEAKSKYWATHGDKASTNQRNGGAHLEYLSHYTKKTSSGFLLGSGLSMADLAVFDIVDNHVRIFLDQMKETYPELIALHQLVESQPGIKEYRASPKLVEKVNGNGMG